MSFGRKPKPEEGGAIAVPLKVVLEDIAIAVQNTNFTLDRMAADMYLAQGYERKKTMMTGSNGQDIEGEEENDLIPIVFTVDLPAPETPVEALKEGGGDGGGGAGQSTRKLNVPATILLQHNSMQLDEVDVTLRFAMNSRTKTDLLVDLKPEFMGKEEHVSEMQMRFKRSDETEGVARVDARYYQAL